MRFSMISKKQARLQLVAVHLADIRITIDISERLVMSLKPKGIRSLNGCHMRWPSARKLPVDHESHVSWQRLERSDCSRLSIIFVRSDFRIIKMQNCLNALAFNNCASLEAEKTVLSDCPTLEFHFPSSHNQYAPSFPR